MNVNHEGKEFATPVEKLIDKWEGQKILDPGVFDYSLNCITSDYLNQVAYINCSSKGEIIGSQQDKVTLFIEEETILPEHSKIIFNPQNQYELTNASPESIITIMLNSSKGSSIKQYFKIAKKEGKNWVEFFFGKFMFIVVKDKYGVKIQDWIKENDNLDLDVFIKDKDIKDLTQLRWNLNQLDEEMQNKIKDLLFKVKREKGGILKIIAFNEGNYIEEKIIHKGEFINFNINGPDNFNFGSSSNPSLAQLKLDYTSDPEFSVVKKDFKCTNDLFRRIFSKEIYLLYPDDILQIGRLQFLVQRFNVGVESNIGKRHLMDDTHIIKHDLRISDHISLSYFGVFDGHEGPYCSKFLMSKLHNMFLAKLVQDNLMNTNNVIKTIANVLHETFIKADEQYELENKDFFFSGSTGIVLVIFGSLIICANVGDSHGFLSRNGKALCLSHLHKPNDELEKQRIAESGGEVQGGRLMGKLAISRGFGDTLMKQKGLICIPEITVIEICPQTDEFIMLASDGLFDVFTCQEALDFVMDRCKLEQSQVVNSTQICKDITQSAINDRKSGDNVTTMLIMLKRNHL